MTVKQRATTIEQVYAEERTQSGASLSTTSAQRFFFEAGHVVAPRPAAPPSRIPPASLLPAYVELVATASASALDEGGVGLSTVKEQFSQHLEPWTSQLQRQSGIPSRRKRHAKLIALIESWLADESDYDQTVWPRLKSRIEESRTSARKRFSD